MSENLPAVKPETDLSPKDLEKINEFKAEGMPGLAKLKETDFHRMAEMYMGGFTYWQISTTLNIPRTLVMYMSKTYDWYAAKREYDLEIQEKIKGRVIDSKLASQDFLLLLVKAYEKKIGQKLKRYLASDNPAEADQINLKEIDKLIKAIETIQSLSGEPKTSNKSPSVGLDLGGFSGTIERSEDKLTITPAVDKHLGSMLKKFAEERRAEQHKAAKTSDIKEDQTKSEEPKNEN